MRRASGNVEGDSVADIIGGTGTRDSVADIIGAADSRDSGTDSRDSVADYVRDADLRDSVADIIGGTGTRDSVAEAVGGDSVADYVRVADLRDSVADIIGDTDTRDSVAEAVGGDSIRRARPGREKIPAVADLIPPTISPCALGIAGETCAGKKTIGVLSKHLGIAADPVLVVGAARKLTGCATEKCAISALAARLPEPERNVLLGDLEVSYKVAGPTGTKLLNNFNIDSTLKQWAATRPDFFAYNFNMRDYASRSFADRAMRNTPDTLATIKWSDLTARGFRRAACVINSDVYSGPGKHWMALFADATATPPSVEFFNSSGSPPAVEWVNWLVKTRGAIDEQLPAGSPRAVIVKVTSIRHQDSRSECGVYSLFYIWARLNGIPPSAFMSAAIPDSLMFEFRQHLFDDKTRAPVTSFDWGAFKAGTTIEWE